VIGSKAGFDYQTVRNAFLAVDTDGDGKLSLREVTAFAQYFGLPACTASQFFDLLDRGDGAADWRQFMAMYGTVLSERESSFKPKPSSYRTWQRCPGIKGQQWHFNETAPLTRRDCLVI
jgi:hypothetical protein